MPCANLFVRREDEIDKPEPGSKTAGKCLVWLSANAWYIKAQFAQ